MKSAIVVKDQIYTRIFLPTAKRLNRLRVLSGYKQFAVGMPVTRSTPRTVPDVQFSRIRFLGCTHFRARAAIYANPWLLFPAVRLAHVFPVLLRPA